MDNYARAFIKASLVYLAAGTVMGVVMLLFPESRVSLIRVHVHILLLGFMAMMIYGVGYHILPRFMGKPVYSRTLGVIQAWLANITLLSLSLSWILEYSAGGYWGYLAAVSGFGHGLSVFMFIVNLWKSMIPEKAEERRS